MYFDVWKDLDTGEFGTIEPVEAIINGSLYCPPTRECDKDCREYKCDRFLGEVINCKNCMVRDDLEKCPVAKYYKTKDTDCCAWHVRKEK